MKPTTIDLFAGAGLLSGAFKKAGFRTIHAVESDQRAVDSFNRNVADVAVKGDVCHVPEGLACDAIVAGPPCQGFSSLGSRNPRDERNRLSLEVVRWTAATGPRVVLIENVPQFAETPYWKEVTAQMSRLGYEVSHWLLNGVDFSVPQRRLRSFTVYSAIGTPHAPKTHSRVRTVREAFSRLDQKPTDPIMDVAPNPSKLALARFRHIPVGGDKRDIVRSAPHLCPPSWKRMGAQATDVWGRMHLDRPANTIRCCFQNASKGRYIHPTENRMITLREGARLQGIPDDWQLVGDRSAVASQIGNGVPLPLGYVVARSIRKLFRSG